MRRVTALCTFVAFLALAASAGAGGWASVKLESTPAGIDCGTACTAQMSGPVTLTATPAAGKFFLGWSGACMGMQATCNVSMTAARSVFAMFSQ